MNESQKDKFVQKSISLRSNLAQQAAARAKDTHGGNLSRYIQELIEADLKGESPPPDPKDARALEKLVSNYAPPLVEDIQNWCESNGITEPRFLHTLLFHLATAAGERAMTPQQFLKAVELVDPNEKLPNPEELQKAIADRQAANKKRKEARELKAAEEDEAYRAKKKNRPGETGTG